MSVEVTYPARITSYSIFFSEDKAQIQLTGVEKRKKNDTDSVQNEKNLANIDFIPTQIGSTQNFNVFVNRGGFLQVTRPLYLLPSILVMLEQNAAVFIDGKGNLKKTVEIKDPVEDTVSKTI